MKRTKRPDRNTYYMGIAKAVRERANCLGRHVGAILVLNDRVISTGYNGTPEDMTNCDDGGCDRCKDPTKYPPGEAYDKCICVHAESNALLSAARFGIPVEGAILYSTMQPCFGCTKEAIQAKIRQIYYLHPWSPKEELRAEYEKLQARIPVKRINLPDPEQDTRMAKKSGKLRVNKKSRFRNGSAAPLHLVKPRSVKAST